MYDYDESTRRLSVRVRQMNESGWNPTQEAKELDALGKRLDEVVSLLSEDRWFYLEEAFDTDIPPEIDSNGRQIRNGENRAGQYAGLCYRIRELADFARQEKDRLPNSRARPAVKFAANVLLHIMYQCGHHRPTLYDKGNGVSELGRICEAAGIFLAPESLRGFLSKALDSFEPSMIDDSVIEFLVLRQ